MAGSGSGYNKYGSETLLYGIVKQLPRDLEFIQEEQHNGRHHPHGQSQSRRSRRRLWHQVQHGQRRPRTRPVHRQSLDSYLICPTLSCDFAQLGTSQYTVEGGQQGGFTVEVVDPCTDYVDLMKSIFNFDEEPVYYPDIKFPVLYLLKYRYY